MVELELTRAPGDQHLFELKGVGTLRLEAGFSRLAVAAGTGDQRWEIARRPERRRFARRGDLIVVITATDPSGTVAGEFEGRARIRGDRGCATQRERRDGGRQRIPRLVGHY